MGFYRALIQATPQSMPGGFYSSSWQTAQEGESAYLTYLRYNIRVTALNLLNSIANDYNYTDPNHPENPVYGSSSNASNSFNHVTGINISNYDKLYLNSNCRSMFTNCSNLTDWNGFNKLDFSYVQLCAYMFSGCYNLTIPVTIGPNVNNCLGMFRAYSSTTNLSKTALPVPDVYIKGTEFRTIDTKGMFEANAYGNLYATRDHRTNIHFNAVLENQFTVHNSYSMMSRTITWTPMSNNRGYYNTAANLYLFNDYEG